MKQIAHAFSDLLILHSSNSHITSPRTIPNPPPNYLHTMDKDVEEDIEIAIRLPSLPGEPDVHTRIGLTTTQQVMASGSPILAVELGRSLMNDPMFNSPCVIVQIGLIIPLDGQCVLQVKVVNGELNVNDALLDREGVLIGKVREIVESQKVADSSVIVIGLNCPVENAGGILRAEQRLKIEQSK